MSLIDLPDGTIRVLTYEATPGNPHALMPEDPFTVHYRLDPGYYGIICNTQRVTVDRTACILRSEHFPGRSTYFILESGTITREQWQEFLVKNGLTGNGLKEKVTSTKIKDDQDARLKSLDLGD